MTTAIATAAIPRIVSVPPAIPLTNSLRWWHTNVAQTRPELDATMTLNSAQQSLGIALHNARRAAEDARLPAAAQTAASDAAAHLDDALAAVKAELRTVYSGIDSRILAAVPDAVATEYTPRKHQSPEDALLQAAAVIAAQRGPGPAVYPQ